jgi:hypothetical protein
MFRSALEKPLNQIESNWTLFNLIN